MLTKTNLKAIRMADLFAFVTEEGKSIIRCTKRGLVSEDEPFAQPDVHHDIVCASVFSAGNASARVSIEMENDAVVDTVLNGLKEEDDIKLIWSPVDTDAERFMLSMNIERKGKVLQYILAVQTPADALQAAA